ncbi:hypothetical protein [uncultured Legionella sp.]|uniref:hypothetical protein n=1 Tax=uncultured Legionella sp. TaxID=210934 RepID=UPI002639F27F|nr:hypothetical protein [uncultured Legionella sp.]
MQAKKDVELNTNQTERQELQGNVPATTTPSDMQGKNADLLNHDAVSEHLFFNSRKKELDSLAQACAKTIAPEPQNEVPTEMPVLRRR